MDELGAGALFEEIARISRGSSIRLGGVGLELSKPESRTKLYLRGRLSELTEVVEQGLGLESADELKTLNAGGFIEPKMQAEVALEVTSQGGINDKWVFFADNANLANACVNSWLADQPSLAQLQDAISTLGGPGAVFALGVELGGRLSKPKRVNVYLRSSRQAAS